MQGHNHLIHNKQIVSYRCTSRDKSDIFIIMPLFIARWIEFLLLFVGLPMAVLALGHRWIMILVLWSAAALIFVRLKKSPGFSYAAEWNMAAVPRQWKHIAIRFLIVCVLFLPLFTWWFQSDLLFSLIRQRPILWGVIMVVYPVFSVWPQELIFRSWINHRYAALWRNEIGFVTLSALAFGFTHVIFQNWVAMILSTLGGVLFAHTYRQHKSLALCCLEHALCGCAVFTIGLGQYFYSGVHFH